MRIVRTPAALTFSGGLLVYTAGASVNNSLTVTETGTSYTFADTAETISCSIQGQVGSGTNTVTVPKMSGGTSVKVDAGDGNDLVDASALTSHAELIGKAGNDTLIGGAGNDNIDGGDG